MAFKLLGKCLGLPRQVCKGDTVRIQYEDEDGNEHTVCEESIQEDYLLTEAGVFEFIDEFGCKRGVGGYMGEK